MTSDQIDILKQTLILACDVHLATGGKIVDKLFGRHHDNSSCPISCVFIYSKDKTYEERVSDACGFDFSSQDMWDFLGGFDGRDYADTRHNETYQLGVELRAKYIEGANK